jgi:protein TonB
VTGVPKSHELVAVPRSAAASAAAVPPDLAFADLTNVVPFVRPRALREAPEVAPPDTMRTRQGGHARERAAILAFAIVSLALHGGALWALSSEPTPFASIGEQVISLEIVIGATAPAGVALIPGENEVQAATPKPQQAEPPRETEQAATAQPEQVPVAAEKKALEEKTSEPAETPAETTVTQPAQAEEEKPRETSRETEIVLMLPPEKKPEAKRASKPVEHAKAAKEPRRIEAPTREHAQKQANAAPSTAANNVGVGRSDTDTNYVGLVSAHLRRHQQYPADARGRHEQGTATVTFGLDGGGRVTSARLVKGSGVASLDQEAQAMVHRASPFPAPPSRHAVSFTVPVTFRLN